MEENKREKFNLKKNLKWIIPGGTVVLAGLVTLGIMLTGNKINGSSNMLDEVKISRLSEEAQQLYADLAADGSAVIELGSEVKVSPILYVNGEKTITGGTIVSDGDAEYIFVINDGARLTIDGTVVDGTTNGIYISPSAEYAMKSGSIVNSTGHSVRVLGKAMISGGKIENAGTNWIMVDDVGTLVVTGGEFIGSGESGIITAAGSNSSIEGATLSSSEGSLVYNCGNMEIKGGDYSEAGDYAIYNSGNLKISDADFSEAKVLGYIENDSAGSVEITGGSMSNSSADFIFNKGEMTITETIFESCSSTALENRGEKATLTVTDVSFAEIGKNVFLNKLGTINAENIKIGECGGMAVHNRGANFYGSNITVEKTGDIAFLQDFAADGDISGAKDFKLDGFEIGFADNYGIRVNGGEVVLSDGTVGKCSSYGLYVKNGNVTTNSCTFLGTTDTSRNTVQIGLSGSREAVVVMNDTSITGGARGITNHATLTFNSGRIYNNKCSGETKVGAGINSDGILYLNGGTIENNHSISTGGGVYSTGACTIADGTIIRNNTSDASGGGVGGKGTIVIDGGSIYGNSAANYGGGIYCSGDLTVNGGTIYSNTAWKGGGGIDVTGTGSLMGGTVKGNSSIGPGGGVYTGGNGETLISGIRIEDNVSEEKGGGGVYNLGWTRIETTTLIQNNKAATYGGGVSNSKSTTDEDKVGFMIIAGGTITGNTSKKNGGGVSNTGYLQFRGGKVSNNTTEAYGGGLYNSGNLKLSGGEISGNTSPEGGGGVENTDYAVISGGVISSNTSEGYGGGIYNGKTANLVISGGTVSGNTSNKGGGGIYNANNLHLTGGTITKNEAKNNANGAGVYTSGDIDMLGGTVAGNVTGQVDKNGKAHDFYVYKGKTRLYDKADVGTIYRSSEASAIVEVGSNLEDQEISLYLSSYELGTQAINGTTALIGANSIKFVLPSENATGVIIGNDGKLMSGDGLVKNLRTGVNSNFELALTLAQAGDTLQFLGDNELSSAKAIGNNLTIIGNGNTLTFTGADAGITNGASLIIENLKIRSSEGVQLNKQALTNNSNLTLNSVSISGICAADNGAAIKNNSGASLNVNGGNVSGCTNTKSDGLGVVHNSGTACINGTSFSGNTAGSGGSIYNAASGTLHVSDCSFSSNTANAGKDIYLNGNVYLSGSIQVESAYLKSDALNLEGQLSGAIKLTVSGPSNGKKILSGNSGVLAASYGCFKIGNANPYYELRADGCIYELTGDAQLMSGGEFVTIKSFEEVAAMVNNGEGDTIILLKDIETVEGTFSLNACTLKLNGKALEIAENTDATFNGVAISSENSFTTSPISNSGILTLNNCSISGLSSAKNGGAVYNIGTLSIIGGSISNCSSGGTEGGGALFNKATATLSGVSISVCSASKNGGGIYTNSSGNTKLQNGCTISACSAANGGGIYNGGVVTAEASGCTISICSAANGNGGGVYNGGTFTMTGGSISECSSSGTEGGGALFNKATATLNGTAISNCTATKNGGGIYTNSAGNTTIQNGSTICGCSASSGGGIYNGGIVNAIGSSISSCTASSSGGGVYNGGTFSMSDGSITSCNANNYGGGLYKKKGSTNNVADELITGNNAGKGTNPNIYTQK